jgi:hypothetical protein
MPVTATEFPPGAAHLPNRNEPLDIGSRRNPAYQSGGMMGRLVFPFKAEVILVEERVSELVELFL